MEPLEDTEECRYTPENPWTPPKRPDGYDELGQEMAPGARVWKKYVEEADRVDRELVEGWNKTLDVILIFAALFSAISTAFVLESSKDLKQDYTQTSAQALLTLSQTLSAIASGSPANVSAFEAPEPDSFSPSSSAVAVNILWFLSLSLSVAVSLIAILAKDWCSHFMSGRVGPVLKQGRLRQQRWNEIERWKMMEVMNVLPLLMHIALLLFAIGLSAYLWDINIHVALPVVITTSLAALFYMVTVSLPLFFRYCPYTTALTRFLYPYWLNLIGHAYTMDGIGFIAASVAWISYQLTSLKHLVRDRIHSFITRKFLRGDIEALTTLPSNESRFDFDGKRLKSRRTADDWINSMRGVLSTDISQPDDVTTPMDLVTSSMLSWMISNCEDPNSINMTLQALAGASKSLPRRSLWECGAIQLVYQRVRACLDILTTSGGSIQRPQDTLLDDLSLYSRSYGFLTAFAKEGGLEAMGSPSGTGDTKFRLTNDQKPIAGMEDAATYARIHFVSYSPIILAHLWTSPIPRYDLSAYEFNNVPTHFHAWIWDYMECGREQHSKQWELIKHVLSGRVSNLPTTTLTTMVNGITKTYLYRSLQSPALPLGLLRGIDRENGPTQYLLQAVGIGLTIAAFSTGIFPMEWKQPETELLPDTEELQPWLAFQAYNNIAIRELDRTETHMLLFFGLVCMLGDLSEFDALSASDILPINHIFQRFLGSRSPQHFTYHSLLPLPPSFGPVQHIHQVLSGLIQVASLQPGQESDCETEYQLGLCIRADTLLRNIEPSQKCASEIVLVLLWDPTRIDSIRLSRLRFEYISDMAMYVNQVNVWSDLLVFFKQVVEQVESTTGPLVLLYMRFLWISGGDFLWARDWALQQPDFATVDTLLPTLYNPSTSTLHSKPCNLHELALADHWLFRIAGLCHDDPASVLDSELLHLMIGFYGRDDYKDAKPHVEEFPGSVNPTWLEILQDLERRCKLAVEGEVEHSVITSSSIEANPAVYDESQDELEDEHNPDAPPDSRLDDRSI